MNIAHLAPASVSFPLKKHNGRYDWMLRLARLQVADGHKVTIYAGSESTDPSGIIWKNNNIKIEDRTHNNTELIRMAFQNSEHDIYHSHFDSLHYRLADITQKPVVFTQHWFANEEVAKAASFNTSKNVFAVPPTRYMHGKDIKLNIPCVEPIPHGIDLGLFQPSDQPAGDRLIFVGRITPHKGVLEAVKLAKATNQKLDIVGRIKDIDIAYWQEIKPLIDGERIKYLGSKTQPEIAQLLPQAKALIFPSQILEAFGQITIEAQACGTPVIINDIGASHEVVNHGKTGFVVGSDAEFMEAINSIGLINRIECRKFAQQFDINIMVDKYYRLYKKLTHSS